VMPGELTLLGWRRRTDRRLLAFLDVLAQLLSGVVQGCLGGCPGRNRGESRSTTARIGMRVVGMVPSHFAQSDRPAGVGARCWSPWLAVGASTVATVASALSLVLWVYDLHTRAECPPGYVRLVDIEPGFPIVSGAMCIVSALALAGAVLRRQSSRRAGWLVAAGLILAAISTGWAWLAVDAIRSYAEDPTNGCWTF